ncbi:TPA: hypothetical protein P2Q98_004505 [Aeromonas veronii]|nr:hypothetical protein [Aeromonas veronii]HDO1336235.1 hypothetical protein [Aeromonas veronii]HDO1345283.1 hypothetical protein [Aeromonas veronii]HDO1349858.1 hypothetical protein [Aeromonas veronii]HDO1363450.1 hypothetical protein [Aeromonas veronii]
MSQNFTSLATEPSDMGIFLRNFTPERLAEIKFVVAEANNTLKIGTSMYGSEKWKECFGRYFIPAEKISNQDGKKNKTRTR